MKGNKTVIEKFPQSFEIAQSIYEEIKNKKRIIVGIDGYSASGKSTVLDCLMELNSNITGIHLDDFLKSSEDRVELMRAAEDKSKVFEYEWYKYPILEEIFKKWKNGTKEVIKCTIYDYDKKEYVEKEYDLSNNILVIEGIFLFHPNLVLNKYLDERFYIEVDFEKTDIIREEREKKRWGEGYVPPTHPDSFVLPYMEAYRRYVKNYYPFSAKIIKREE